MRYNHESYLPIRAFQQVLGRMTFHGGGGGGVLDDISDAIGTGGGDSGLLNILDQGAQAVSNAAAAVDDAVIQPVTAPISQAASALDDAVLQPITAPISDVGVAIDHAVADVIPGGWGTLAQVAAAATGNPYIIGATSAGVNYAKNKDLQDALEAGLISGGTAGITQGIADAFELGDVGKAGLSAGIGGGIDYAKNGDINSALKAGAIAGGTSYAGSKLGEFSEPYFNGDAPIIDKSTPYSVSGESTSDFQKVSDSTIDDIIRNSPTTTDTNGVGLRVDPITLEPLPQNPNISNVALKTAPSDSELDKLITEQNAKYPMEANIVDKSTPYSGDPIANESIYSKLKQLPEAAIDTGINYAKNLTGTQLALLGAGAYGLSNLTKSDQEPATTAAAADAANKAYTYGTAGKPSSNYLLKNKINASNIYSDATKYRPLIRNDVHHFGIGGSVSDALTRVAQPFEKAIVRPIGEAVPFAKDLAPYAGIAAGAMIGNPAIAAGIGGIASGFGKPGGFDMKRALMGGIAAYGMSNLAGGLEAAGGQSPSLLTDAGTDVMEKTSAAQLVESGLTPEEALKQSAQQNLQQGAPQASNSIFRDPSAIKRGIGNLLENSNSPTYKNAMAALTNKATGIGIYNTGLPLIMGTTGVMGVDESNALKAEYDKAAAANQADADKFNATVAAGKKRAQQAVTDNPYKFATGGEVNPPDDQTQLTSQTPMKSMQQTAPLQGLASNPQMQQPMGNIFNDGIRGLFSQLNMQRSYNPFDEQTGMPSFGGQLGSPQSVVLPSYGNNETSNGGASTPAIGGSFGGSGGNAGAFPLQGQYGIVKMAAGGMPPRFLSGGGDGMSDSIRANIEGTQEARLADGEFVIPADVVSHLGNGSSKAGAKQLYDMMDRVRKARTGNPKQGREIKPTKLMPV